MDNAKRESLDVSCRATAYVVHSFLLNNRPASCLVDGLPYSLTHLQNVSASISWDHYLVFIRNCHQLLTEEEWIDQSTNHQNAPYLRSMLVLAGLWLFPANCFAWGLGERGNFVESIFRCLKTTRLIVSRQECLVEYQLRDHYTLPPNYFWQALSCGFVGSAPTLGLSPIAAVTWEPVDRGARFRIVFPRPSLVRYVGGKIRRLLRRDVARHSHLNQKYLLDRERWLQQEVTKRIDSEVALRESESQFRVLMEAAPEAILVFDVDEDRILSVNRNAEKLFCHHESVLLASSLFDLIRLPGNDSNGDLQLFLEQVLAGTAVSFEFNYTTPDGRHVPCEAHLVRLPSNQKLLIRTSITNISARKQAELELVQARDTALESAARLKLRERELTIFSDRLKEVIRITGTGIFEHNHADGTVFRSAEIQQIYGRQSTVGKDPYDFMQWVAPEDQSSLLTKIQQSHNPESDGRFQHLYRVILPSGQMIWCEAQATTFFEDHLGIRTPVRTVGAVIDVTERITREELLKHSRQCLQAILESTADIVFSLDRSLCYLAFNGNHFDQMQTAYGVQVSVGKCILDFFTMDNDRKNFAESCRRALDGERFTVVQPYGDSSRSRSSYEISFNPICDESGHATGVAVFARDTISQILAQNALRESEEIQRLAIEVSELGLWRFNTRTRVFTFDARCQYLFEFNRPNVSEEEFESRIHQDDLDVVLKGLGQVFEPNSDGIFKVEHRIRLPNGKQRWVTACGTRLIKSSNTGDSADLEIIGTTMDVTEQVQTSNLLTASLREKEAMLKEIHHRVKNNLQVISSLLSLQAGEIQSDEVREFSLESQRRVKAMALVHETLYQTETLAKIDMAQYVKHLCDSLIQSYGSERAIVVRTVDEIQLGLDHALPIGLILSELITNAFKHAFPERSTLGHITVGLRNEHNSLWLIVQDDGVGLPANLNDKVEASLGIKLVRLLTQQLNGRLTITTSPGASFQIEMPHVNTA